MTDMVRVRARSTILGLVYGEVASLELTDQIDALLRSGKLELLDPDDDLLFRATRVGLRIDGRWGLARLREEVAQAEAKAASAP